MTAIALACAAGLMAASLCLTAWWALEARLMLDRMRELEQRLENLRRYLDAMQRHRDCEPHEWLE